MLRRFNPATIAAPLGAYSHAVEIPKNARWLSIAGQGPVRLDGTVPESFEEQHELICQNILAILEAANMGPENLVHLNVYSTDPAGIKFLSPHRRKYFGEHIPSSTWVVISGLAIPGWLVEVEALAAKADD